jgi:hypothetical protein
MNNAAEALTPVRMRTMQIIAGALLTGVLLFIPIALVHVQLQQKAPVRDLPVLSVVAVVMLASCAPLAFLLPAIRTRSALQRIAAGTWQTPPDLDPEQYANVPVRLLFIRQLNLLIGLALLEGAAFMGCIAYMLEAHPISAGVVGVAVGLMVLQFPTRGRVRVWLERQMDQLAQLRRRGDRAAKT